MPGKQGSSAQGLCLWQPFHADLAAPDRSDYKVFPGEEHGIPLAMQFYFVTDGDFDLGPDIQFESGAVHRQIKQIDFGFGAACQQKDPAALVGSLQLSPVEGTGNFFPAALAEYLSFPERGNNGDHLFESAARTDEEGPAVLYVECF
jgi:hypothetical protein